MDTYALVAYKVTPTAFLVNTIEILSYLIHDR